MSSFKTKIIILATISFLFTVTSVHGTTPDLVSGYNGYKWGSDISKHPEFTKVENKTPIKYQNTSAYKLSGDSVVKLNNKKVINAEEIHYIVIEGKLEAVYIVVNSKGNKPDMAQAYFFLKNWLEDTYGKPSRVSDTGQEAFFDRGGASLKLSMGKVVKMILYAPTYNPRKYKSIFDKR